MFAKLEPLASHIHKVSQQLYIPASNLAIDEMIVCFSGRSAHTFRIKNKPTPEDYRILSLCESGYTYSFMFTSRIESSHVDLISNINKTGLEVPVTILTTIHVIEGEDSGIKRDWR
ncbi:21905_t:CDS:2 [Dentiscutata erythropus]|uniref:21905_t:CDS:1 n=1 Tax=Dentiscutata erythropus TaxID=1348616 RepID=A0A9N9GTV4_9GLOM|nr:21905_t:CDS:2 [Dentiscutata erythropus]